MAGIGDGSTGRGRPRADGGRRVAPAEDAGSTAQVELASASPGASTGAASGRGAAAPEAPGATTPAEAYERAPRPARAVVRAAGTGAKPINLALQGGGSHGALTWGVLDRLLEDERLAIRGISGTSAGAMNAVALADGYVRGGPAGAREALAGFWRAVSEAARGSPMRRSLWDRLWGRYSLDFSPGYLFLEGMSRVFSPYELNPFNLNPLRDLVAERIDFGRVARCRDIEVHVTATNVRTGRPRIFSRGEVTIDAVMASACLPQLYPAVEIDGEAYWDGGFTGNPALYPLVDSRVCPDIVVVQINPVVRQELPRTAREIINRVNEVSFNSSLIKELGAISVLQSIIDEHGLDLGPRSRTFLHLIHVDSEVQDLAASSKLNAEWSYLKLLFDRGRRWADAWLECNFDAIGEESTFDLSEFFAPPARPEDQRARRRRRRAAE